MNHLNDKFSLPGGMIPTRLDLDGAHAHLTVGPCNRALLRILVQGARRFTMLSTSTGWVVEKLNARGESEASIGVEVKDVTHSADHEAIRSLTLWHQRSVGPRRKVCERPAEVLPPAAVSSRPGEVARNGRYGRHIVSQRILVEFDRQDVEALDLSGFLRALGPAHLPSGPKLAEMMGTVTFFVHGYDDGQHELWEIPAVRRFYQALWKAWPYALYFADLRNGSLHAILLSCLKSAQTARRDGKPAQVSSRQPDELVELMETGHNPLIEMWDRAGLTDDDFVERMRAFEAYFMETFFMPVPPGC